MGSICRFLPIKEARDGIQPVYFVYETEFHKLKQPFVSAVYYIFLVTKGCGVLHLFGKSYPLQTGTLFCAYPGVCYTMDGSEDFTYMYISVTGSGVADLLGETCLDMDHPVHPDFTHLIDFWRKGIQRIRMDNANILTESVLFYTLSFLTTDRDEDSEAVRNADLLDNILKYVGNHYSESDLTLKKIAGIFSYSEKYLSQQFKQKTNTNFNEYLNHKRISHALRCIRNHMTNVTEIAEAAGYSDSAYFVKVFKKRFGETPRAYIAKFESTDGGIDQRNRVDMD